MMDIQATKLELLKEIMNNDNSDFLQRVADFVRNEKSDFWNDLSLNQQEEIKKGIEELNSGKRVSFDSFIEKASQLK